MDQFILNRIPILTGENWNSYKIKIEIALKHFGLWPLVMTDFNDGQNLNGFQDLRIQARNVLIMTIDDKLVNLIDKCSGVQEIWQKLNAHFGANPTISNVASLLPSSQHQSGESFDSNCIGIHVDHKNDDDDDTSLALSSSTINQSYNGDVDSLYNNDIDEQEVVQTSPKTGQSDKSLNTDPYFQTNDLTLWPRLTLLDSKWLLNLRKFYTNYLNDIYWLFMNDGTVFKFGHSMQYREDYNHLPDPEEVPQLKHQNVCQIVYTTRGNFWFFLTENLDLYAMGDNSYGQLGTGNKDRQLAPILVDRGVEKVACGDLHTLTLDTLGYIHTCGSHKNFQQINNRQNLSFVQGKPYFDHLVLDIACMPQCSLVLTKPDLKLFIWGTLQKSCFDVPTNIAFDIPLPTGISGGLNKFLVNTSDHGIYSFHLAQQESSNSDIFTRKKLEIDQPIKYFFNDFNSNDFLMMTIDGHMYFSRSTERSLIHPCFKSIPDSAILSSKSHVQNMIWIPSKLVENYDPNKLTILNNPSNADIIFKLQMKPIYAHRSMLEVCSDVWRDRLASSAWQRKYPIEIENHSHASFFCYMQFIYTGKISVLSSERKNQSAYQSFLCDLRRLGCEFGDNKFCSFVDKIA